MYVCVWYINSVALFFEGFFVEDRRVGGLGGDLSVAISMVSAHQLLQRMLGQETWGLWSAGPFFLISLRKEVGQPSAHLTTSFAAVHS